jgi:transposase
MDAPTRNGIDVPKWMCHTPLTEEGVTMKITTIGIDLAKSVFQIHGVDGERQAAVEKTDQT